MDWIQAHSAFLNVVAAFATLVVWVFYAQILFNGYRRQRRPRILINKGVGNHDLEAPCLIGNMSHEAIFIQYVLVRLKTSQGRYMVPATDDGEGAVDEEKGVSRTRQGPMQSGEDIKLHSFRELIEKATKEAGIETRDGLPADPDMLFKSIEIIVIYIYGPDSQPLGASRTFDFRSDEEGTISLHPNTIDTNRLTSRHHRRQLRAWLHKYL